MSADRTVVLVHGAWHGAWSWNAVVPLLEARGLVPRTLDLPSVGAAADDPGGLSGDAAAVGRLIDETCGAAVLCGHSYGGMVITGVADRMPERVRALVYLDAFVPEHGDSLNSLLPKALPPEVAAQFLGGFRGAALEGNSGLMQPIPAEVFNVAEQHRAWVNRRCVAQPLATFEMPLLLTGKVDQVKKRLYILADGWDPSPFRHFARTYVEKPGWDVIKMPCGHDVMVDMPKELAGALARLA